MSTPTAARPTAPVRCDIPFAVVHRAVGAIAAGDLEEAFDRLLRELEPWGLRAGELLVDEGELHRLAGDELGMDCSRCLPLYDGHDVVGELRLDLEPATSLELLELLQDIFGLGLGRRVRARELDLVRAAVAVNAAESFDAALEVLAETCCRIAGAPNATVTVWESDFSSGSIRAAAGDSLLLVGEIVRPGGNVSYAATRSRRPELMGAGRADGLSQRIRAVAEQHACALAVPLLVDGVPRVTFQVSWRKMPTALNIEAVTSTVEKLDALTTIAYRAARERERAAQHELLRTVIETVPDGIWIEHEGSVTTNAATRRLLRLAPDATPTDFPIRRLDGAAIDPADYPSRVCRATGREASVRARVAVVDGDDRIFDLKAAPMPDGYVGLIRDVTEEYDEQVLTQHFLESLFASLPLAAIVADAMTGEIVEANASFQELVGLELDEIRGQRPPYPWWSDPQTDWRLESRRIEKHFRHSDGRLVPVELHPFLVRGADGTAQRSVRIVTDLSERREFERQLVQSGKLAAIGELAAGVAHEINNPLFAILGLVEFLLRDAEPGTKAHERLGLIQQTGFEIKEIVRALLDFARERTDEHRLLLLPAVVGEAVELVRRTSGTKCVELVERYDGEPAPVLGSPNQIKQIVLNLLTNAQQAMPDGGTVAIEVAHEEGSATVTVTDSGPGIPPAVLPRIFEPFYTTKRDLGGTGLGLAVSHGIAEMHGGDLVAESPAGGGAVFRLRLPRAAEEAA